MQDAHVPSSEGKRPSASFDISLRVPPLSVFCGRLVA